MSAEPVPPTAPERAPARYRLVRTTTERDTCQCCGRTELKRVVVLHDGEDYVFFGSQCAARLLGTPVGDLNREATTAQRQRERADRAARDAAQRQADRAAAVAAGFGDDLDAVNAFFTARACARFHTDPATTASFRAGLAERHHAAFDRYLAAGREPQQRTHGQEAGHER